MKRNLLIHDNVGYVKGWLVLGGAGSVWGCTGWYLVVLGQSNLVMGQNNLVPIDIKLNWVSTRPVYIEKSGDLVGCYHSGTNERTNKQGKIELLSQLTMDG